MLNFQCTLAEALQDLDVQEYHEFNIHELEIITNAEEILEKYGQAKWAIVDAVNQKLGTTFDLYNWLHYREDELAYFLNEAGSNTLNYSQYKAPAKFHLWLGRKGFIVGIEQKGLGFNAHEIDRNNKKQNEGAAFDFFRKAQSTIFFDNPQHCRIIFMYFTV